MRRSRRDERAVQQAEVEDLRPFLDLARAMHDEAVRVGEDPVSAAHALDEAVAAFPRDERRRVARAVFDALPPLRQWEVLERVYGDREIAGLLAAERAVRRAVAGRTVDARRVAAQVVEEGRLDTTDVPPRRELALGLFAEHDVRAAVGRGAASAACARRLVLRSTGQAGAMRVIEDTFNPDGGYFVTAAYDERTWRTGERLPGHARVRVGAITTSAAARSFEPVLYPAGRVDVETDAGLRDGLLHLGWATLDGVDLLLG